MTAPAPEYETLPLDHAIDVTGAPSEDWLYRTFPLEYVIEVTGAPSEDWLYRRIIRGEVTAVRAGKKWRMTRSDMCSVVAYMRTVGAEEIAHRSAIRAASTPPAEAPVTPTNPAGLSKRGAARMQRRRATA
ncbi:hypothetical protein [Nocardia sp. NPDC059239]|uniref:hypothetical protein n=1 Tax=unclassified Nocardia TaxID=2637762 RepID=UPI00367401AD